MTDDADSTHRPPADDVEETPDWDLSVAGLNESEESVDEIASDDASGEDDTGMAVDAGMSEDHDEPPDDDDEALVIAEDQLDPDANADPDETELEPDDSGSDSYQTHFLDDEEPESEYVAHVDRPPADVVHVLSNADALTEAMASERAPRTSAGEDGTRSAVATSSTVATSSVSAGEDDPAQEGVVAADLDEDENEDEDEDGGGTEGEPELVEEVDADDGDAADDDAATTADDAEEIPEADFASTLPETDDAEAMVAVATGGGWTIPLLCLGIAIIACCLVIPQADVNRRLVYERTELRSDLESIQTQVATNDEFLRRLASDPTLAERLAQRQLGLQRAGTRALPIGLGTGGTSPFDLVQVTPPPPPPPYEPLGGQVAAVCRDTRSRLYLMGVGLFVLAAGLILGVAPPRNGRIPM